MRYWCWPLIVGFMMAGGSARGYSQRFDLLASMIATTL
jgi:hypothetical protein